jgi:hypothetical protein
MDLRKLNALAGNPRCQNCSKWWQGGGFILLRRGVPSAARWFGSTRITQAVSMPSRTRANYTRDLGFPSTTPPGSSASAQAAQSHSTPGRTNIRNSRCSILCLKDNDGRRGIWLLSARLMLGIGEAPLVSPCEIVSEAVDLAASIVEHPPVVGVGLFS